MAGNLIAVVLAAVIGTMRYSTAPTWEVFPAGFWISLATYRCCSSTAGKAGNWFTGIMSALPMKLHQASLPRGSGEQPSFAARDKPFPERIGRHLLAYAASRLGATSALNVKADIGYAKLPCP